jgi:hypothetical protein
MPANDNGKGSDRRKEQIKDSYGNNYDNINWGNKDVVPISEVNNCRADNDAPSGSSTICDTE